MIDPNDARAWFEAFFADPVNGFFTLLTLLCLVYLIAVAKNLADPAKRDAGYLRGALLALGLLAVSMAIVFVRGDNPGPVVEPTIDCIFGGLCE